MSKTSEQGRVLNRLGARRLESEELNQVAGGFFTHVCTFNQATRSFDGDCSPEPN